MQSRCLLSAAVVLAMAFGCAAANAQFAFLGGRYPVTYYIGPEGGFADDEVAFVDPSMPKEAELRSSIRVGEPRISLERIEEVRRDQ